MRPLRLEKLGIRGLGIAESFAPESAASTLAGVVMRNDMIVDGFVFGHARVFGNDATKSILEMYRAANRNDIGYVLMWGTVISGYNMVDIHDISESLGIPVMGLSGRSRGNLRHTIMERFPDRLAAYDSLGERHRIRLRTGSTIHARMSGCTKRQAGRLLDTITIQGAIPEPLRLARLLASARRA